MSLTAGLQLPFGIQPVNPTPVDAWSGPYSAATAQDAIDAANAAIPAAIRYQSMEVRLIVGGVSKKYWYRDGIADADLVEFASGSSGSGGSGGSTLLTELVLNETPTGVINGVNTAFTLAYTPATTLSVMLWLNGQLLTQGVSNDFTVGSQTLTMSFPPQSGDISPGAADEMTLIDDRLVFLDADKASCTQALARTSARSFADVVGKLDVASRILSGEGGLVHDMVADAVAHLPRFFADRPDIP
jgi:uncharacterized RDD family membrane protein YckC